MSKVKSDLKWLKLDKDIKEFKDSRLTNWRTSPPNNSAQQTPPNRPAGRLADRLACREELRKCVICKSSDIQMKTIEEEIKSGKDIVLISLEVLVCQSCGERYYDRKTMQKIEVVRSRLRKHDLKVEEVGRVLRANVS